jgi:integrase
MRNPNGYGSITKLSGKRRNPWMVRITTGYKDDGVQIRKVLGYYKDHPAAIKALAEYNANPYDINVSKVTFADVYEKWSDKKYEKISHSNVNGYKLAYKLSSDLHDMRFVDIKSEHLQEVIDTCGKGYDTLRKIRVLYNQLFKYAMEKDIVSKDYSKYIELPDDDDESSRKPFTKEEIQKLWDNVDNMDYIDTVLIMIYTGLRPGELVLIETAKVNVEARTMIGGLKTKAGKNRVIPINKKILPFIEQRVAAGYDYLVPNENGGPMSYYTYYDGKFKPIMEQLQMDHKPHDCRHTFATLMDNAGANKLSIKRIMGHASQDITDKVYTHKDIEQLLMAVDLI